MTAKELTNRILLTMREIKTEYQQRARSLEDIVANINNECRCCSTDKDCSICVWKYQ